MDQATENLGIPPIGRGPRVVVGLVSAAVLVSAVAGAVLAAVQPAIDPSLKSSWALVGFEVVVAVAALLGVIAALGKFGEGPGMALACVAGTILLGSALGWQGAGRQLLGHSLMPYLAARVAAALVLGAIGAWVAVVLSRIFAPVSGDSTLMSAIVAVIGAIVMLFVMYRFMGTATSTSVRRRF